VCPEKEQYVGWSLVKKSFCHYLKQREKAMGDGENLLKRGLDSSAEARTRPEDQLHSLYLDGYYYRQVKRYKGSYCLGVEWENYDPEGSVKN
jgi:hypothetical protein